MAPTLLTLTLVTLSTIVALPLGLALGLAQSILFQGSRFSQGVARFTLWITVGLLSVPLYVHAAGWQATWGRFGWLPFMRWIQPGDFSGLLAASWIHGCYGISWVSLGTLVALRRRQSVLWEAANLESTYGDRLTQIALPLAAPLILVTTLYVALQTVTEMAIADLFGVTTIADWVYKYHALTPNQVPLWLCVVLPWTLVLALYLLLGRYASGARLADHLAFDRSHSQGRALSPQRRGATHFAATGAIFITALVAAVPLLALLMKAGWVANGRGGEVGYHFSISRLATTLGDTISGFTAEFYWSAYLVAAAVLISVPCGWALSVCSSNSVILARVLTAIGLLLFVIPGPAAAVMTIAVFNRPGLYWLYDQTLIPTLCALMTRTIPIAFLAFSMAGGQHASRIRDAAHVDGVGFWERFWFVERRAWQFPALVAALWVGLYVFADLSTTILVLPPGVTTVATRIFGLLHSGVRHQEAGLALFSFFVGSLCTILGLWLLRWYRWSSQH